MKDIHGGNIDTVLTDFGLNIKDIPKRIHDFSINLNPLGPPSTVIEYMTSNNCNWSEYPEPHAKTAVKSLAIAHNVKSENLVVGNGATELFGQILQAFDIKEAASLIPCYSGYKETCESKKIRHILIADLDSNLPQAVFYRLSE